MTADCNERHDLVTLLGQEKLLSMAVLEGAFIINSLGGDPMGDGISYTQVTPEEIGALTDAPIITDGTYFYGYMDYQIKSFMEELAQGRSVIWQKG